MKIEKRLLAILMCICLLHTSVFGCFETVFAEEAVVDPEESVWMELSEEHELQLGAEEELVSEELVQVEPDTEVIEPSVFSFGYAKILYTAPLYAEFEGEDLLAEIQPDGIIFVSERRGEADLAWFKVAFVYEGAIVEGWVNAEALMPLNDDEIARFQNEITEAVCYLDDVNYPLPEPAIVLPEAEPVPEQTPVIEESPEPSATPEPTLEPEATPEPDALPEPENTQTSEPAPVPENTDEVVEVPEVEATKVPSVTDDPIGEKTENIPESVETSVLSEEPVIIPEEDESVVMMQTALFSMDDYEDTDAEAESAPELIVALTEVTLRVGESFEIRPEFSDGIDREVSYSLDQSGIISIDVENAVVTACAPGEVTVHVKSVDLQSAASISITVEEIAETEDVQEGEISEGTEERYDLKATLVSEMHAGQTSVVNVELEQDFEQKPVFVSSDNVIAMVDEEGNVTALAPGECVITVSMGEFSTELPLTVHEVPVDSDPSIADSEINEGDGTQSEVVSAEDENSVIRYEMSVGETLAPEYGVSYALRSTESVVYSAENPEIAAVDPATGVITAISGGETAIVASLGDDQEVQCYVTVRSAPTRIEITNATKTVGVKQVTDAIEYTLYAGDVPTTGSVTFKSSNTKILKVNSDGQMLGVKAGKAKVTVTAGKDVAASVEITVKKAPSKLTVSPTSAALAVGQSAKINYTLTKNTAAGMTFESMDKNILTVDKTGKVKAVGVGKTKIKVSTHNGLVKYSTITVGKAPENVTLKLSASKLGVGMTATAKASVDASSNASFTYKYWTDSPEVVSVDAKNGEIKALKMGEANIFVETYNGVTSHASENGRVETFATVKVVPKPDNVMVDGTEFNIIVGQTIKLPVKMTMKDGSTDCMTTYKLATSNKKIAQVNDAGQVKGVKAGTATIRMTAASGQKVDVKVYVRAKPRKVVLNKSSATLGIGMKSTLQAKVYYSSSKSFVHSAEDALGVGSFASSNNSIVKVDAATGVMTAAGKGTATVKYTTLNGKAASCKVTVLGEPTKIGLNKISLKLGVGMTAELKAVYEKNEMGPVRFSSSDTGVAKVDSESGKITAVGMGSAQITIDAGNGVTNTCSVKVVPKPDNVTIDGTEFNIIVGQTIKLPVQMTLKDGSTDCMTTYKLATSSKKIAQVNDAGQVKGVKAGTATVRLTAASGQQVDVKVYVRAKPRKVVLNKSSMTLGVGMNSALKAKVYYSSSKSFVHSAEDALGVGGFASSDASIVKVDSATGAITAVGKGTATVKYKTINGKSASCKVTVYAAPTSIKLNTTKVTFGVDMTASLKVSFNDKEYGSLSYKTSDKSVAKVGGDGKITAVGVGEATITAAAQNGVSALCKVTVVPAPDKISLNMSSSNLAVKGKITLQATATHNGSDDCKTKFTYKSSNSRIAKVSDDGVVQGLKTGSATIRVMAHNGVYADCKVVVRKAPKKVQFEKSNVKINAGETVSVAAKITYSGGSCMYSPNDTSYACLSIDDSSIAKLDQKTGVITGLEVGYTDLRIKTYNGKTAKCRIVVAPGPDWIALENEELTLSKGQEYILGCGISAGSATTLSYSSSNSKVVKVTAVDGGCKLSAVGKGSATVTATSSNGKTSVCGVTVLDKPQSVLFAKSSITIGEGETAALPEVKVASASGDCDPTVTYSISGNAAVLEDDGRVTGVKPGTAKVTATVFDGLTASCTVKVVAAPASVTVSAEKETLTVGASTDVVVKLDTAGSYILSVDNADVLGIGEDGAVKALKVGTAIITATAYNGCSGNCTIEVKSAPEWIRFDVDTLTLGPGMERSMKVSMADDAYANLTYITSDSSVAVVDESGKITAVAPGTATVRVYVTGNNKVFDTCRVTVLAKPDTVKLSASSLTLRKGASVSLKAAFSCESGEECLGSAVYKSSNTKVATVDESGRITAKAVGKAVITAFLDSDSSVAASCKVIVIESSVGFDVDELTMSVGETYALRVDLPEGKNDFSIVSSNPEIVELDSETYVISALAAGSATITAVNGTDKASCEVTVSEKPTSIKLSASSKQLVIGQNFALNAKLLPEGTSAMLTYSSSDKSVASVTQDGIVTATGYGSTVVRAANRDGSLAAECRITSVYEPELIRFGEVEDIIIAVGDSYVLETPVMYNPNGSCSASYTLSSSNAKRVRVSYAKGRYTISGVSEGTAVLRLKTANGKTATHNVTVVTAPTAIGFADSTIRMAVGERFSPEVFGNNGSMVAATLTSSNTDCVAIASDGSMEAVTPGTATITAVSDHFPHLKAQVTVKVVKAPASITISPAEVTLAVGERSSLTAVFDSEAASADVTFASTDESVVKVSRRGVIQAVGVGTAKVMATTFNGLSDSCTVTVKTAPTSLKIQPGSISACVKDSVSLKAVFGSADEFANLTFSSDNKSIAAISKNGVVTFSAVGETVIHVSTFNGLSVDIPVTVSKTPSGVSMTPAAATILKGDAAKLDIAFNTGAAYYTLSSSDSSVVKVSADGTVKALKAGTATITLNASGIGKSIKSTLKVVDKLTGMSVKANKSTLELHEKTQLVCTLKPADVIGTGGVTFKSSDSAVAKVNSKTGEVTGVSHGTAVITAASSDGQTAKCEISVLGGKRRMMVAYYFGEAGDHGYLPFAYNNGSSMARAFAAAEVEGQKYDIAGPMSNASKSSLLGTIDSHFADATDDDVSVIYICAHGSQKGVNGEYSFKLNENHYVTASELMNRIEKIKGRVVLILDTCYSGGVIDFNKSRLDAQGGRISVLTSSHHSTTSSYWNVSQKLTSIDFFTHALLQGIGFNEAQGIGGDRGWFASDAGPADDQGNNNGRTTVAELFAYAKKVTVSNIAKYKGYKQFHGNPAQVPYSYIGSMNKDLVLFARE